MDKSDAEWLEQSGRAHKEGFATIPILDRQYSDYQLAIAASIEMNELKRQVKELKIELAKTKALLEKSDEHYWQVYFKYSKLLATEQEKLNV